MTSLTFVRNEQLPTVAPKPEQPCGLKLLPKKTPQELALHDDPGVVRAECNAVLTAVRPATLEQFGTHVERLALHYPESRLTPLDRSIVIRDWRRLLGHLPVDILAQAVDDYLMSPARFFPTPGALDVFAAPMWRWRSLLARRATSTLAALETRS